MNDSIENHVGGQTEEAARVERSMDSRVDQFVSFLGNALELR